MLDEPNQEKSTGVTTIRESVKKNIRIARLKHRQDEIDNLRITLGELEDHSINLVNFIEQDVLDIAMKIKRQRNASHSELLKLCHAFLQSPENISCLLNSTGSIQVIVKELTGTKTESQLLAVECLCNLSLGSESDCEKIARRAGSYLHTFLQSSNESFARTTLWCLTNLIVAGNKPLQILLSQELIKALINATNSCHNENAKDESTLAIELALDCGGIPKQSDIEIISKFILDQTVPLKPRVTRIAYKLLNLLGFQSNDSDGMHRLTKLCFETLIDIHDTPDHPSASDSNESVQHVILLMRICSNIVVQNPNFSDFIINCWFETQNRSMGSFLNDFIELVTAADGFSVSEIYWFIGNLLKCHTNESTMKYLEFDNFFTKLLYK